MLYKALVTFYQKLEKTTKRLEKTSIISQLLKNTKLEELPIIVLLIQGKVFPNWDERKIGVASKLILKAISLATGINSNLVEKTWKSSGDLGITAEILTTKKKQSTLFSQELTIKKVFINLRKLSTLEGSGSIEKKISLIAELLTSAKPIEARYIVRTILEELRVGVGEGALRDAIVWSFFSEDIGLIYEKNSIQIVNREAYNKYVTAVQNAYDATNDFSEVVKIAKLEGLKGLLNMGLVVGRPIKVMLALKVNSIDEGFERCSRPCELEYKYDGFRIQIHKINNTIKLFTRRLENVTKQFPDVVEYIKNNVKGKSFILDSEAVGYDPRTKKYLPFQNISQRIKRKYDINKMVKELPIELNIFDIVYYEGKTLLKEPFKRRRALLEKIITPVKRKIVLAKKLVTQDNKKAEQFYKESLNAGNEGIMFKNLEAPYQPGARVGFMVKLKPTMETLDLVIVGAEWGEGKSANWLSSYTVACRDEDGNFLEIGQVGTGIKEKHGITFRQLTEELKPLIINEKGKEVKIKPKLVVEVSYEEIQKSPTYSSGFALRFPRFINLRPDRSPHEITTLDMIKELYKQQKKT